MGQQPLQNGSPIVNNPLGLPRWCSRLLHSS
jgi:hypothetical protein